jgi:hypothetical protein
MVPTGMRIATRTGLPSMADAQWTWIFLNFF